MHPAVRPLYFWHIPKTAGTSLIEWLDGHFPASEVFSPQLLPELRATTDDDVRGRSLYRGHLGSELPSRLDVPVDAVTVLREPRARTLSHLGHIWRAEPHYLHERLRASGPDLLTALRDPLIRRAVTDVQARYLALAPERTTGDALPLAVADHLAGQARFELGPLPSSRVLAGRAVLRLWRMAAVGTTEQLDAFASRVATARGWRSCALARANVAPSGGWRLADLTAREVSALDAVNRADHVVHRVASSLRQQPRWRRPIHSSAPLDSLSTGHGRPPAPALGDRAR